MNDKKDIQDLINLLDQNMANGSRHINVKVNDPGHINIEEVNVVSGPDCSMGDVACKIPNLPQDDDDEF